MIDLDIIIEGLETVDDETTMFFDRKMGDTVMLNPYVGDYEVLSEAIEADEDDRFIRLPSRQDINEYGMMEDFIDRLPDGRRKDTLYRAISGRGAFRRFKDTIDRFDLSEQWYAFRDRGYARVAKEWCEENDIDYYYNGTIPLEDEDEDGPVSLAPSQLVKLEGITRRLSELQGALEDLADEADGEPEEVLSDAASDIEDILDRLGTLKDVSVDIVVDGNVEATKALSDLQRKTLDKQHRSGEE